MVRRMNAQTPVKVPEKAARKLQLRAALSVALDVIAYEGQTQREAARRAGMHETALARAIAKPHVQAELERRKQDAALTIDAIKGMAKAAAYRVGLDLMHNSPDHKVRAKMVELFAGETRGPAVVVQMNQHAGAGYVYTRPDELSGEKGGQVIDMAQPPVSEV